MRGDSYRRTTDDVRLAFGRLSFFLKPGNCTGQSSPELAPQSDLRSARSRS